MVNFRFLAFFACLFPALAMGQPYGPGGPGVQASCLGAANSACPPASFVVATAHDEIIGIDGVMSASGTTLTSASALFTPAMVGKVAIVDGAGPGGTDLITTVAGYNSASSLTLVTAATYATPWQTVGRAYHASSTDITSSYAVGDILSVSGGTTVAPSTATVTFSNGSANIAGTGLTLNPGELIQFTTTGSLPTGFSTGTNYYVLPGATSTQFQVGVSINGNASGTAITAGSAGSGTQTAVLGGPAAGQFKVVSLEVSSPTVNAGGSGGTTGSCTVIGTTGVTRTQWEGNTAGTSSANGYFTATGTVSGGALTGPLTIVQGGDYSTAPTVLTAEPVVPYSGCGALTGATVSIKMGPHALQQVTPGHYTTLPSNPVSTTGGTGAGATLSLWGLCANSANPNTSCPGDQVGGYWAVGTDDSAAINAAIARAEAANGGRIWFPAGRSLMLSAFNITYTGTNPPTQPSLVFHGAGNLGARTISGGYTNMYLLGTVGTIIDNRYAGGDAAGHVAKLDTRGMGNITMEHMSLADYGTDNLLWFLTTNTLPDVNHITFLGNPTCYEMTCQQPMVRLGGITSASGTLSGTAATNGYQPNSWSVQNNIFGFTAEALQLGAAANSGLFARNMIDSTSGQWTAGAVHVYGGATYGSGYNTFLMNETETTGYQYDFYVDTPISGTNTGSVFISNANFDGSGCCGSRVNYNGAPTLGAYYFNTSTVYNQVIGAPEDDMKYSFVVQAAATPTNSVLSSYISPSTLYANGLNVLGNAGFGTQTPTYQLEIGNGTGNPKLRINGGNTNSADGACLLFGAAGVNEDYIGTVSGCLGGSPNQFMLLNTSSGEIFIDIYNNTQETITNGQVNVNTQLTVQAGTPTISSGACGTGTNGSISGYNQSGKITIGASATAACAVSFSATLTAAPSACTLTPANTTAAALGTGTPYISALSSSGFTLSAAVLASTSWYYTCL